MAQNQSANITWLLDDLVERLPEARQAVVLSADGLLLGSNERMRREDAEHLSAIAAGFQSLAKGASRHLDSGAVRQTVVEMEDAFLLVTAAGSGACLAVVASTSADLGLIAYEMALLITRVGQNLEAPSRFPGSHAA
ncbi:roadblock/LC7 domain-containing protein [Actinoplanes couchii]|uniref:Dynein regulation protein LC7 n=1 Tax=Actinoplanes couchii TaxID=403638 RepID=A0ABQ3XB90_9ACTN|nr:roadblock/LC7 domain-containing protein [Actinoplanes couchii]MDR6323249.1 putative regulator of Ras-like GTPase activity (Roadblock/LC7/MglB family) [Actinoplanes couchii]GID55763.1 dynein regulation protein LC7 [Actinoplanes couchii]